MLRDRHEYCTGLPAHVIDSIISDPLTSRLPPAELNGFLRLSAFFRLRDDKHKRNLSLKTFAKHLGMIYRFVVRDDGNSALRGLVCGIIFADYVLVVNTDRLKKFTCRSKSCVNTGFQRLGFEVTRATQDLGNILQSILPISDPELYNPRRWCIRKAVDQSAFLFKSLDSAPAPALDPPPKPPPTPESTPHFFLDLHSLLNLAHPLGGRLPGVHAS